ncbi:acyl-CoA N-acyltransferase [Coniochaeta sp. 2T2.1]|nr:acyl-CoA N-acyltransferase [Coniochaeta sp. 2T2.1]
MASQQPQPPPATVPTPEVQPPTTAPASIPDVAPQPTDTPIPEPVLTLSNCLIRPYHPLDAAQMAAAANTPLVSRFMRNTFPHPYDLSHADSWISLSLSASPIRNFGIYSLDSSTFLGSIGVTPLPDNEYRTYELGYWIAPQAWGKGVATEAVRGFVAWVFGEWEECLRVEARVVEGNGGSEKVLAKVGFVREGFRRGCVWSNAGERLGMAIWGLLKEECLGKGEGTGEA